MEATRPPAVETAWLARRLERAELEARRPPPEPFDWRAWRIRQAEAASALAVRWRLFSQRYPQPVDD